MMMRSAQLAQFIGVSPITAVGFRPGQGRQQQHYCSLLWPVFFIKM